MPLNRQYSLQILRRWFCLRLRYSLGAIKETMTIEENKDTDTEKTNVETRL